ncbi:hypothetical protein [Nocardia sp. alder85J]|uniref:hypothetical protein n=1 Tax=Nocardia sp. alder85J TaxID=2862949 RepID=UPI001CD70AE6|nr:hypothetical protein [Nocardia sp. alder85J]MCX4098331.1 hypothetical protein [Nocardia sp. alder85J]
MTGSASFPRHRDDSPPGAAGEAVIGSITVPPRSRRAPVRRTPFPLTGAHPPLFAVVAAHGGAGATTLARWWAHAADGGRAWPGSPDTTQRVVLAARTCMPGLVAAADRLREWRAGLTPGGVTVTALVLTPVRPGRLPASVRRYRDTITDLLDPAAVFNLGWHDELIALEPGDLAVYTPFDPLPRHRRWRGVPALTVSAPIEAARAGAAITALIAASRRLPSTHES